MFLLLIVLQWIVAIAGGAGVVFDVVNVVNYNVQFIDKIILKYSCDYK